MKVRFGLCALFVVLAGCSDQDSTRTLSLQQSQVQTKGAQTGTPVASGRNPALSIANAPDRGGLVDYDRRTSPVKNGAFTSHKVALSEEHALRAAVTGKMKLPLPDGSNLALNYERHAENIDGNWTWVGRVEGGDPLQEAIITFGDKAVFGSIPQGRGLPNLELTTRNGALWLVQTDPARAPLVDHSHTDTMVRTSISASASLDSRVNVSASTQVAPIASSQASAAAAPANTVDVVLGYTNGMVNKFGGQSQAVTRMSHLVEIGNQAYANSAVNGALRLVGTLLVSHTDGGTNQAALVALTGNTGSGSATIPSSLAPLRSARDQFGGDLVALVRAYEFGHDGCGITWLLGANQQEIRPATDAQFGYAIVSDLPDGMSAPGDDGKQYFCPKETLVHELGHLMGSAHDRDNSKKDNGETLFGRYVYSFGHKTDSTTGNFFTIMAYGSNGQRDYRVFSNPNLNICGGRACGVANQADNSRSLNQTIPIIASFRETKVPFAGTRAFNDFNGDGSSDLLWFNSGQSTVQYSLLSAGQFINTFASFQTPAGYAVVGSGHFDNDLLSDLLLVNAATRSIRIWLNRGGYFESRDVGGYSPGWSVATFKDLDGDGISDILFQNVSISSIQLSTIRNGQIVSSRGFAIPAGFSVIDVANVDGRERPDLILENAGARNIVFWLGKGEVYESRAFAQYGAGWSFAGTGDFNCDGTDDVVWTNESAARFEFSYLSNAYIARTSSFTRKSQLRVARVATFTGDLCADLVVDDMGARQAVAWKNSGATFSAFTLGGYSPGWTLL